MASLLRTLRQFAPDVIHFQWLAVPSFDRFYLPALKRIAPIFMTVHDSKGFLNPTSKLQMIGWDEVLRSFDGLVVHLEASKRELLERGVPENRIHVIPHGVLSYEEDLDAMKPAEPTKAEDKCEILLFGAIKPYKGTDVLIRAMAELPKEIRQKAHARVVGEPFQDMDELRKLAAKLGVEDCITWDTRYVPNEEIPEILRQTDIIAYPYRRIDASGVLMMTLPYAKPIVATAVGCFAELLEDGESALIVPPENPKAFAQALERVILDPELGRKIGLAARDMALGQLSWEKIAVRTEQAYRKAITARPSQATKQPSEQAGAGRVARQLASRKSYDSRPVKWRGLLDDEALARDIGGLLLFVAFADQKLVKAERSIVIEALSEMDEEVVERKGHARKLVSDLLDTLDLSTENLTAITDRLSQKLDEAQKNFLVEVLYLVAFADGVLLPSEEELLNKVVNAFGIEETTVKTLHQILCVQS
jgi:glycosyltransferase involved in cell wall biosynthesis/uncharacterized tellurite resistance protein B-like protein